MYTFRVKGDGLMNRSHMLALATVCAVLVAFCLAGSAEAQSTYTVVMSGLDNPRGLTFAPPGNTGGDGEAALYVAEAGKGGPGPCLVIRGQLQCAGATGAVSRSWKGEQTRIVTGLPSYAPQSGAGATGPHDVSFKGGPGLGYVAIGLHGNPSIRAVLGDGFGWIARFRPSGVWSYDVNVAAYEAGVNPAQGPVDSNPHGLLEGAGRRLVIDSGGNVLLQVDSTGDISTLAVFPSRPQGRPTDSVPTAVAVGPDGAYYVGELTGVPFSAGVARIYRVVPGEAPQIHLEGFTAIIDLDFDREGNLYVLQHATGPLLSGPGALIRVAPSGERTLVANDLSRPTSVAIGPDCHAYVSNRGTSAGIGEVIQIEVGCPEDEEDDNG
jgi:hypothetical protein